MQPSWNRKKMLFAQPVECTVQASTMDLPRLPPNAHYLHGAPCHGFGSYGWVLRSPKIVDAHNYQYFIFMDATARGPFLPIYSQQLHWSEPFLSRLNAKVKLVGPSISCRSSRKHPDLAGAAQRGNPYVQVCLSY
jgi:hypothetical protein